ncbi:MAG: type I glyceraldehyde-3-phosphate dehydrogenase [bacterium]|nr:type I glyceraldehyde-3-phosphate dehydrogenase [bacterium]MDT8365243.1 type I glyceraldehyde-3-phosphate dehydrogenase [bacterium]
MAVKVAINGFGRIGRLTLRSAMNDPGIEFVAINDLTDAKTLNYLFCHDSIHGSLTGKQVSETSGDSIIIGGRGVKVFSERDPSKLPWKELGVDVVLECTGLFTTRESAAAHLDAGASHVIISAPGKGVDLTVVMGVNHSDLDPEKHRVISNASCTTNCLAPVAKVLDENFGIIHGVMTTVHAYTSDQRILDQPHRDLRRARAAALSMIPTTTGAASAVGEVLPQLKGKLDGLAVRVPTPNVSLVDLSVELKKGTDADSINAEMKKAAENGPLAGFLVYNDEPLVSVDFNGWEASSIFDAPLTKVVDGTLAKVMSWYDNEYGYASRLRDLAKYLYGV